MKNIESAIEETARRGTRPTARERAHKAVQCRALQTLADEESDHDPLCDRATAAIAQAERDVLAEVAGRFPSFEPTGQEHNCCARCHEMVHVEFGKEWEDGDVCTSCSDELYQSAKSYIADRVARGQQ